MNLEKIYLTAKDGIFSDLKLILKDQNSEIIMNVHKHMLYACSPYFEKLLTNCKEANMNEITIIVPNASVCYIIIMSFYGKNIDINIPNWKFVMEKVRCNDFLGLEYNIESIYDLSIPVKDLICY